MHLSDLKHSYTQVQHVIYILSTETICNISSPPHIKSINRGKCWSHLCIYTRFLLLNSLILLHSGHNINNIVETQSKLFHSAIIKQSVTLDLIWERRESDCLTFTLNLSTWIFYSQNIHSIEQSSTELLTNALYPITASH